MEKRVLLIYGINGCHNQDSWKVVAGSHDLLFAQNLRKAVSYLTYAHIDCIVIELSDVCSPPINEILYFQSCFQTVPIIIYGIQDALTRFPYGVLEGAIGCIPRESFERVLEEIPTLICEYSFSPDLGVFRINPDQCPPRIKKALALIQKNFRSRKLSISMMAFLLNVHRCHFEREFQRYCLIPPKRLIIGLKLSFAAFLMQNQGMKLWHIAQLAGFPDYYEFCKIFCRHMGMTPREFRRNCQATEFPHYFKASNGISCDKTTTNVTL